MLHVSPNSKDVHILKNRPELIKWSDDGSFVLIPNLPKLNVDHISSPRSLKDLPGGFALNAWYIHPKQLEETIFSDQDMRKNFSDAAKSVIYAKDLEPKTGIERSVYQKRIRDIEIESGIPYIASVFDLRPEHVPWLKELKHTTLEHLRAQYGVTRKDHVNLFFHGILDPETVTLHLHVMVNQGIPPAERNKSYLLDDVIHALESGRTVKDMALERTHYLSGADPMNKGAFLKSIPDITMTEVENPFIRKNPYIEPWISKNKEIPVYLLGHQSPAAAGSYIGR